MFPDSGQYVEGLVIDAPGTRARNRIIAGMIEVSEGIFSGAGALLRAFPSDNIRVRGWHNLVGANISGSFITKNAGNQICVPRVIGRIDELLNILR